MPRLRTCCSAARVAVVITIVLFCGGAVAQGATLSGPDGALHGCVGVRGAFDVIPYGSRCARGARSVFFGARGKTGATGPAGGTAQLSALSAQVSTLEGEVTALKSQVQSLQSVLSGVTRHGNTLLFTGMNLQVESGAGATDAAVNGLGNVIIGYDENPGKQTGSHNLVLGDGQAFTSYGEFSPATATRSRLHTRPSRAANRTRRRPPTRRYPAGTTISLPTRAPASPAAATISPARGQAPAESARSMKRSLVDPTTLLMPVTQRSAVGRATPSRPPRLRSPVEHRTSRQGSGARSPAASRTRPRMSDPRSPAGATT